MLLAMYQEDADPITAYVCKHRRRQHADEKDD